MHNLIKMDMYRLFKSKAYGFGLIVSVVIPFVFVAGIAAIGNLLPLMEDGGESLFFIFPYAAWFSQVSIFEVLLSSITILSLLITCVISSNFISEEQTGGYIKNIAGQVKDKGMLIASKFVTVAVISFSVIIAYIIGSSVAAFVFLNKYITYENLSSFISVIIVRYVLYLAVNSVIILLCTLTKNKTLAVSFGIVFGTGITRIAYSVVATFFELSFNLSIPVASYTPDGLVFGIGFESTGAELAKAFAVGVCYIVIFLFASSFCFKKKDTK